MFRLLPMACMAFIVCEISHQSAAAVPSDFAARQEAWQQVLDRRKFVFPDNYSGLLTSLGVFPHYRGDCKLHVMSDPDNDWLLDFRFVRNGREILTLRGDAQSAFVAFSEKVYFAKYSGDSPGCTIQAYDLKSGERIWQTDVHQAMPVDESVSSRFTNRVMVRMSTQFDVEDEQPGSAIVVTGKETHCDYVEVLDSATGDLLARKVYRKDVVPEPTNKVPRQNAWSATLDQQEFLFPEHYSGLLASLRRFSADYKVHVIFDPMNKWRLDFKFIRDGHAGLSLQGHDQSAFDSFDNKLYFAKYSSDAAGCTVLAYDLSSGKKLWETDLRHATPPGASAYANVVTIRISREGEANGEKAGAAVVITGRESYCDYMEVLDRETGTSLAVKNYRVGFGDPPPVGGGFDGLGGPDGNEGRRGFGGPGGIPEEGNDRAPHSETE